MPDGIHLLTDRYHAADGGRRPVVLMRTPYGRGGSGGSRRSSPSRSGATRWWSRAAAALMGRRRLRRLSRRDARRPRHAGVDRIATMVLRADRHLRAELPRDRAVGPCRRRTVIAARDGSLDHLVTGSRVHLHRRRLLARQHADVARAPGPSTGWRTCRACASSSVPEPAWPPGLPRSRSARPTSR